MTHKLVSFIGLIGSGKTTAANVLLQSDFIPFEEDFGHNAFLADYYLDMPRWAFHSQMYFLIQKIKQNQRIIDQLALHHVSQDFPLYQDLAFAKTCHHLGNLSAPEWELYHDTYKLLNQGIKQPDLIIYLQVTPKTAIKRIRQRGRQYEQGIEESYLAALQTSIEELLVQNPAGADQLVINANTINLVDNQDDIQSFFTTVNNRLNPLKMTATNNVLLYSAA